MQIVPLQPVPAQILNIQLDIQDVTLNVYQKNYGLFIDVYLNNVLIIAGQICQNLNPIIRGDYIGFIGNLGFIDLQSDPNGIGNDPIYTGLGSRYVLAYLEASDLA
jgi:hypothetical protein